MLSLPFHAWTSPDGENWLEFHRLEDGICLRFPGLADFKLNRAATLATCFPAPGTDEATLDQLYLNQVLPLARSGNGTLSVHASAVAINNQCVAFLGPTGRGKSTLAASFAVTGEGFLTDDGLTITCAGEDYTAEPSHPSLRLWQDSGLAVLPSCAVQAPPVSYTSKSRFMAGGLLKHCTADLPLRCLFFLGADEVSQTTIKPLAAAETAVELLWNCFVLDIEDKLAMSRQFDDVTSLCGKVPGFRLDYPRNFDALETVRKEVVNQIERIETQ